MFILELVSITLANAENVNIIKNVDNNYSNLYKSNGIKYAKEFNIKCDGVSDDTLSINNALKTINHQILMLPEGSCLYRGGGILNDGVTLLGAGRHATKIFMLTPNAIGFTAFGYGSGIRSLGFNAKVPQTGGSYVILAGTESFLDDFYMDGDFNGVLMTGSVARIRHGRFQDGAKNAIRIRAEGGDNSQMIEDVLMGAQQPQIAKAGIRVRNSSALMIKNSSVIQQGTGLLIDPYSNTQGRASDAGSVFSLWVDNCFFDNSSGDGIKISPTGNAHVVRSRFSNNWTSSSEENGININNQGTGTISGIQILGNHSLLNKKSGIKLTGSLQDISIDNNLIGENNIGIAAEGNIEGLRISNSSIGLAGGVQPNHEQGISIDSQVTRVIVVNNDITGNGKDSDILSKQAIIKNNFGIIKN